MISVFGMFIMLALYLGYFRRKTQNQGVKNRKNHPQGDEDDGRKREQYPQIPF